MSPFFRWIGYQKLDHETLSYARFSGAPLTQRQVLLSMADWFRQNPKKGAMLSMMGLIYGVKKIKQLLTSPKDLTNKVCVITGGAAGLGLLIALKLHEKGCIVIVWDVNKSAIDEINDKYKGNRMIATYLDVTNKQAVDEAAKQIIEKYSNVDILINNAGVVSGRPLLELTEKDIRKTFEVNIISHFWTLKAFLPSMIANKSGHIVNIISTSAMCPVSHLVDYAATKAAARSVDLGIYRELVELEIDEGIVVTGIYPHFMDTGMFKGAKNSDRLYSYMITGRDMLSPEYVAEETMNAIIYEKREVILPYRLGHWLYIANNLPHFLQDHAAVVSNSMREFVGGPNRLNSKL